MEKMNNMILKHFLPAIIAIVITTTGASYLIGYKFSKDIKEKQAIERTTAWSPVLVLYALSLIIIPLVGSYKKTKKFAAHAAREYIVDTMKDYPDLKKFQQVLCNRKAMNHLATIISNNLRPSEQKIISDAVFNMKMQLPLPKDQEIALVRKTLNEVVKVIGEHASVHPEFIDKVYMEMARADMIYIFSTQKENEAQN